MDYNAAGKTLLSIKQEYQPTDGADDAEYQATAGLNEGELYRDAKPLTKHVHSVCSLYCDPWIFIAEPV